ncbi:MAG: tRNA (cytidine(34)-2'-O)-methyltransferase [Eubacteriales bacterium]|nr:tRNA (cytidine(34)-2'-O)-methyltransferase [Eubacteriales bacterium]
MLDIVLVQPEIPQNTGNIGRTCVITGCRLHLVGPLGFSVSDTALKRAGLDYWPDLDVSIYTGWDEFWSQHQHRQIWCMTTKGTRRHVDVAWPRETMMLFGRETAGLPPEIRALGENIRLPMGPKYRSYNLSNSVAVAIFEYLRQWDFPGLV